MGNLVKQLELALLDPKTRKSPLKLNELLADDFFEFTQSGLSYSKKDIIDILPTLPQEQFSVRDYHERLIAQDTVLVHYVCDRFVPLTELKRCTLCSSIWQNRNDRWQMIFFQGTPAK
jgi:hypothetical protein